MKPNTKDLLTLLMKSKADSTVKRNTKEIVKSSRWCNLSSIRPSPPFSVLIVIAYLHKVYVSSKCYATLLLTHAALKWFHSFIPSIISNPLDAAICHNLLEAAKRSKPVVSKKEPISADIIKKIIDKYAGPSANLKDLHLAFGVVFLSIQGDNNLRWFKCSELECKNNRIIIRGEQQIKKQLTQFSSQHLSRNHIN